MLQTLSVIGTGGHAAHADKCGVYIGTILNGEINVDEHATIRIVDMLIQQPQKKEEDENDS